MLATTLAASGGTTNVWFSENALTFKLDTAQQRWRHADGVASVELGRIAVADLSDDETVDDKELRYVPLDPKCTDTFVEGEMTVSFNEIGSMTLKSDGGFAGVQLVDDGSESETVFAVLNPTHGDSAWLSTGVEGQCGKDYVIRYEIGKVAGFYGKCVRYMYRAANETNFLELATVSIAEDTERLGEVAFVGGGTVTDMEFGFKGGDDDSLTMDIGDVEVKYGVDFTNATVRFKVDNYWKGANYDGAAYADLIVYWCEAEGGVVDTSGAGGILVSSNGVYEIGNVSLPSGDCCDYRFKVYIYAKDETTDEETVLEDFDQNCSGARKVGTWFSEDAETFASGGADGVWAYDEGTAFVTNGMIEIQTGESANKVKYTPKKDVTNGIVTIENEAIFEAAAPLEMLYEPTNPKGRVAGLTLIAGTGDDEGKYFLAAWRPDAKSELGGEYVKMNCSVDLALGVKYRLGWTINHETGYLTYSCNGAALVTDEGVSSFEIPIGEEYDFEQRPVSYFGKGWVKALEGEEYNANVAATVIGGETTEYATVDEAVEATKGKEGAEVMVLWDATWRPKAEEVGRTIQFTGDHKVYVDPASVAEFERNGYRVIDNGDGSMTIGVIEYYLKFAINGDGGTGEMADQAYSITNMVFEIASNKFEREGWTFTRWNAAENGSAANSWEDGATIDMTEYGLTNMTLYAQWKIAVRTIVIEAADEFVYIERVTTNGIDNASVRYFCDNREKATGKAIVSVNNGSDFIVDFSTDIEKMLSFVQLRASEAITGNGTVTREYLPTIITDGSAPAMSPIQLWALAKGITFTALSASPYANSSYKLNADKLITDSSRVEIYDVKMLENGMSFKISVDGKQVSDTAALVGMIKTADSVDVANEAWETVTLDNMHVGSEGEIRVTTDSADGKAKFMKIVIPSGN